MANLPGSIKNLNTLLGEQLTEGGGGGIAPFEITITETYEEDTPVYSANKTSSDIQNYMNELVDNGEEHYLAKRDVRCKIRLVGDGEELGIYHGRISPYVGPTGTGGYLLIYDESDSVELGESNNYFHYIKGYGIYYRDDINADVIELVEGHITDTFLEDD